MLWETAVTKGAEADPHAGNTGHRRRCRRGKGQGHSSLSAHDWPPGPGPSRTRLLWAFHLGFTQGWLWTAALTEAPPAFNLQVISSVLSPGGKSHT